MPRHRAKSSPSLTQRPHTWALPVPGVTGLPNFHQVGPTLYRGAQPTDAGFAELRRLGVRTVINLRAFHSDRKHCQRLGLEYIPISIRSWHGKLDHVHQFLRVVTDPQPHPVFFHCLHGADRTGTMCAVYRMVVEQWTVEQAVHEMIHGGYGFHRMWRNLVRFVHQLDVHAVRTHLKPAP